MAGCECPDFQEAVSENEISRSNDGFGDWGWGAGVELFWEFCPWCGSKLEAEGEAE